MTPDGRYVIFITPASTLQNRPVTVAQLYRKDRQSGVTTIITATPDGTPATSGTFSAAISDDGRYVAFANAITSTSPLMPSGTLWVLRDLALNTFVPIVLPTAPPSSLPLTGSHSAAVTDKLIVSYPKVICFSPDGSRLLIAFNTTSVVIGFSSYSGTIFDYNVSTGQIDRSFAGVDDTQFLLGTRANIDPRIGIAYSFSAGALSSCPLEAAGRFVYDQRLGRVRQLVGGTLGLPASSADGRRLLYAPRSVRPPPARPSTYLWDAAYDVPLPMPEPVRAGWMDAAGTMAIFDSVEATILAAGADTNGVADVFAVDLLSRLDRDGDGLDDRWEIAMGLDYSSDAGADGAAGDPDGDGVSNQQELAGGTHPRGVARQFLAEGADNAFFKTRLAIANPGATAATAVVRLDGDDGTAKIVNVHIPGGARRTVFVDELPGHAPSFAAIVDSNTPLVAERTMSWGATDTVRTPSAPPALPRHPGFWRRAPPDPSRCSTCSRTPATPPRPRRSATCGRRRSRRSSEPMRWRRTRA